MDTMTLQADEIEALTAIYGDELVFYGDDRKNFVIDLHPCSSDENSKQENRDKSIKVELKLPAGYPLTEPPCYTISAPWMSRNKKLQLTSALDEIYSDNAGESILYMWIEKCREFLNEDVAKYTLDEDYDQERAVNNHFNFIAPQTKTTNAPIEDIDIIHGETITDRKSAFQAHLSVVTAVNQAKRMIELLKENKKIASATHNISAYRISGGPHGTYFQDCDDDGENQAGGRLLHLLQILDVKDVVVVVSRWFGGIQLGADRFKHINHVARDLIEQCGRLPPNDAKEASKKKKAK